MGKNCCSVCDVAAGVCVGLVVGMAAAYLMSGDEVLLRRNLKKVERRTQRALHRLEKKMR